MSKFENNDAREFSKLISTWKEAYKFRINSFVAVKTPDGPKLLIGRIFFDSVMPQDNAHFSFESAHILAGTEIFETSVLDIDRNLEDGIKGDFVHSKDTIPLYLKKTRYHWNEFFSSSPSKHHCWTKIAESDNPRVSQERFN